MLRCWIRTSHISAHHSSINCDFCREDELEPDESVGEFTMVGLRNIGLRVGLASCMYTVVSRPSSIGIFCFPPEDVIGMGWRTVEVLPLVLPGSVLVLPYGNSARTVRLDE